MTVKVSFCVWPVAVCHAAYSKLHHGSKNASPDKQIRSPFAARIKIFCDTLDETAERVFCGRAAAGCIANRYVRAVNVHKGQWGHQKYRSIELFT